MIRLRRVIPATALATFGSALLIASANAGPAAAPAPQSPAHGAGGMGMGMGKAGAAMHQTAPSRNYSSDDIRILAQAFLIRSGWERLKIGDITETENDSYTVAVLSGDGELVRTIEMSKATGRPLHRR